MKLPVPYLLPGALLMLASLASCDTQRSVTERADPSASLRSTASATVPATPAVSPTAVSFHKEVTEDGHRFVVETKGEGSQRQLILSAEKGGRDLTTNTQALNGTVTDVVATDLNDDKSPELLIFVSDAGSGSYGQVVAYSFLSQSRQALTVPDLAGAAAEGYQGQDVFKVQGQELLRSFPLYKPADPNCCPSGGTRTVRYKLPATGAAFQQVAFADQAKK
ncbi:PliI family lysozyme inhibitor of I-type lysozyme [Hymenobacter sp. GOD-10R]|uniref:PliI family lysozyme inhibitor of I-type lysozyme n=1 Tax=Hymenobacter sp. GOD-10R TaxID=3093922 RepID=UPI002D77183D|nr:PliI family lysozyme inhibitor of I-type lysozyme [Hymenobacter sp. GOD-10R]WRQ26463.1 PliI family lysozyme inhibitor of I-type lysozyme [Hymenobacter sp. GOD-10R]